jgi:hypothetical protein
MTRKHILPLTYALKIPAVLEGRCTQTIRVGRKFKKGDLVMFHGWEGKPYRSKWSFRTPYWKVKITFPIVVFDWGLYSKYLNESWQWGGREATRIAEKDFIDPPTGEELKRVLFSMHKIPPEGLPAQIIRWTFSNEV